MSTFQKPEDFLAVDHCYGEIYEFEGLYWAEVIVLNDGYEQVTLQSKGYTSRENAKAWLAQQGVAVRQTLMERIETALKMGFLPGCAALAVQALATFRRNLKTA